MGDERGLIFLHLPKTGGTTLRGIVRRQYPRGVICETPPTPFFDLPAAERAKVRVLQGHVPFGAHEWLAVPVDYVTMLREPVDRLVSLYHYARRKPGNPLHPLARALSLHDFAASGHPETLNHQTRMLSGRIGDFTPAALAPAQENLATRFACFGTHARFDESVLLFRRRLGWGNVLYLRENVTRGRPAVADVPPATLDLIRERNALDVELYAFASARLDEILAAERPPASGTSSGASGGATRRTARSSAGRAGWAAPFPLPSAAWSAGGWRRSVRSDGRSRPGGARAPQWGAEAPSRRAPKARWRVRNSFPINALRELAGPAPAGLGRCSRRPPAEASSSRPTDFIPEEHRCPSRATACSWAASPTSGRKPGGTRRTCSCASTPGAPASASR